MKMKFSTAEIDNAGSLGVRRATIELNPVITNVLSRDLYKKPVESMFREILVNALDAQVEAGTEHIPVEIKLPTAWDETFHIRDFGPGLSDEQIMDSEVGIYLDYGRSGRRHSNELHGGLGLGTKSPLAYANAFAVTSWQNGQQNDYLVYFDQDNIPCVDHRNTEDSDEPTGLRVSLTTLNPSDWAEFHTAAAHILKRVPKDRYKITDDSSWLSDDEATLPPGDEYNGLVLRRGSGMAIVMGVVAYEVDTKALVDYCDTKQLRFEVNGVEFMDLGKCITFLTSANFVEIHANIGDFQFHPSREFINITPRVVRQLVERLERGLESMLKDLSKVDFRTNLLHAKLTGQVPQEFDKVKTRIKVLTRSYGRSSIPPELKSWWEVLNAMGRGSDTAHDTFPLVELGKDDFTDYLGRGRSSMQIPEKFQGYRAIVFVDTETTDPVVCQNLNRSLRVYDIEEELKKWRKEREGMETAKGIHYTREVEVVRSMSDPKHNVLLYDSGNGQHKKDWVSAKHNVATLKAMDRTIFWVPTRMGCLASAPHRQLMVQYDSMRRMIPKWYRPIILGLPASKGTKTLERAFTHIGAMEAWLVTYLRSDYFRRRQQIAMAARHVKDKINLERAELGKDYRLMSWCLHLVGLCNDWGLEPIHSGFNVSYVKDYLKEAPRPTDVEDVVEAIEMQLPELTSKTWFNLNEKDAVQAWAKQLADLTGLHPTGRRFQSDFITKEERVS